jgi:hypothetical protein
MTSDRTSSTASPVPRRGLTDADIAQALQPFHPQASTDDLEDYARWLLGETCAGLQSGAHVCICGRAPDGTLSIHASVLEIDSRKFLP